MQKERRLHHILEHHQRFRYMDTVLSAHLTVEIRPGKDRPQRMVVGGGGEGGGIAVVVSNILI